VVSRSAAALVVLAAGVAHADTTLPGGATIAYDRLLLHEDGNAQLAPPIDADSVTRYFNLAHCACSQPAAAPAGFVEATYAYELHVANATTPVHRPLEIWFGPRCDDATQRAAGCHRVDTATIADLSTIPAAGTAIEVPVFDLMAPEPTLRTCDPRAGTSRQWAIADGDGDGVYDYFAPQAFATDALPPALPTAFSARSGAGSIELSWTPPADTSDLVGYQALCANTSGAVASRLAPPLPRYSTARLLCGESLDVPLVPSPVATDATAVDAELAVAIPQPMAQLDPAYLCGEAIDPAATSLQLRGLPPGQPVLVEVLAIDRARNPSVTYLYPLIPAGTDSGCGCGAGSPDGGAPALVLVLGALMRACGRYRSRRSAP
jgi:hypothetical protein